MMRSPMKSQKFRMYSIFQIWKEKSSPLMLWNIKLRSSIKFKKKIGKIYKELANQFTCPSFEALKLRASNENYSIEKNHGRI